VFELFVCFGLLIDLLKKCLGNIEEIDADTTYGGIDVPRGGGEGC
jgi:hypothetical protein